MRRCVGTFATLCFAAACGGPAELPAPPDASDPLLVDVTATSGVADVRHYSGSTPERYLPETMGGGVALFDADDDGALDLYLVDSRPLAGSRVSASPPANRLFLGDGALGFRAHAAGVEDEGFGMGAAVGDVDGDGADDLYVTNWGPNALFVRTAPGRFERREAGVEDGRWSVSAGFFDADRDGDLDLYVVNYVRFSEALQRSIYHSTGETLGSAYPHPDKFDGVHDGFFANDGRGRFEDAATAAGLREVVPGKGLGLVPADLDADGDLDVYVANDSTPNFLFVNDGAGRFRDVAASAGCAFNRDGVSEASMGVDVDDVDGDGALDLFLTHLELETNTLYLRADPRKLAFLDRTRAAGLVVTSYAPTGFGCAFLEVDADGRPDLFVANGGIHDNIASFYADREYAQGDTLMLGRGGGRFEDAGAAAGPYFSRKLVGRGVAVGDLDGDGDPDLVVGNSGGPPVVLENRATGRGKWIALELASPGGTVEGARVVVRRGELVRTLSAGRVRSYASASDDACFCGLGSTTGEVSVDVTWPSGGTQRFAGLAPNVRWTLVEGVVEARRR